MIMKKIQYKNEEYSLELPEYLIPFMLRQIWSNKIRINEEEDVFIIDENQIRDFIKSFKDFLQMHLDEFFIEDSEKEISERPGRYQKVFYGDSIYQLNYRMKIVDKIIFQMIGIYNWLESKNNIDI
jgi:hypothetical protein